MEVVNEILKWPIIIQGALGSLLFWIIFVLGQKLFNLLDSKLRKEQKLGRSFGKIARDTFRKK
jgi:hypothetical protein